MWTNTVHCGIEREFELFYRDCDALRSSGKAFQSGGAAWAKLLAQTPSEVRVGSRIAGGYACSWRRRGLRVRKDIILIMTIIMIIIRCHTCRRWRSWPSILLSSALSITSFSVSFSIRLVRPSRSFTLCLPLLLLPLVFPVVTWCSSPLTLIMWPKKRACLFLMLTNRLRFAPTFASTASFLACSVCRILCILLRNHNSAALRSAALLILHTSLP